MARRHFSVVVSLVASVFSFVKCSQVNQVYALPPVSMFQEHQNASAATIQAVHVMKPPEILLRNNLLHKINNSQPLQQRVPQTVQAKQPGANLGHHFPSPPSKIVPTNAKSHPTPPGPLSPLPGNIPVPFHNVNQNFLVPIGPTPALNSHSPAALNGNATRSPFPPGPNSFNEIEKFLNFVPLDYENGQMPGFAPPHQKRAARPANRRAGRGPPLRRNSTSPLKSIISSFHEKVSRIFLGPRRRGPKPMRQRQPQVKPQQQQQQQQQQNGQARNDLRFDPNTKVEGRSQTKELQQTPTNDRSFTAALNTVAHFLQQNQYFPMMGTRERVRTLSQEESQHLDSLRRRDRKPSRRRPYRRRHPRKRRPFHSPRDRPPYEDDVPEKHPYDQGPEQAYHPFEEEYSGKPKYRDFPKHFDDDVAPHKDHGPPYKFKPFKSFRPWKPSFESHEDHEEQYRGGGYKKKPYSRKPAWYPDSHEKELLQGHYHYSPHNYPHKEYSPESYHGGISYGGFKPIKPYYSGGKDWDENKMKFHNVVEYDHGAFGSQHYGSKLKHGALNTHIKDEDARIPKIIINHHHNLPPASAGSNFVPGGAFPPASAVLSYTPPVHFHGDNFFAGPDGMGRGKKEYRSNEFADSFIVNDYGKPPIPGFGMPPASFGVHPDMPPNGPPPPGVAASPPMGGHMVFNHFAQNMPPHFMPGKMPAPNQVPYGHGPPAGPPPVSYSNSHFPRPMLQGGNHYPTHSPGFPAFRHHPDSNPFASQMASYNDQMNEHFPQAAPMGHDHGEGPGPGQQHLGHPPPPPDSSPFPSTNEHHDASGFIPPFTPVPTKEDEIAPTQGPSTPESRENFFKLNRPRQKVPRKFEFKIVKTLSSGFDIPDKLTSHPLAQQKPNPVMNYFDLGVPDREHYKKKQRKNPNNNSNNNPTSREDHHPNQYHHEIEASPPTVNHNKFESAEFNYSTLPENWRNFRPDPSHNKLPSLTHEGSTEMGSRMSKFRSALNPKSLLKNIINRFPRARITEKSGRGHTKFTPYDAIAKSREDMGSTNRKRRKSTKTPASIQDIIDSDSSNHNREVVVALSKDELDNNSDLFEGGASSPRRVVLGKKRRVKKPKSGGEARTSNEMQTEMPFNGEVEDDVLLGINSPSHSIDIPVRAEIRMGEAEKKKK